MAYDIPTTEPEKLRVGDTWQWTRELSDFPASIWTLTYHFRNAAAYFDVNASADGDTHSVNVAMATTGAYSAGRYNWTAFATDGSSRHEVGSGIVEVLTNIATAGAYDGRTWARITLDAVEAALLDRATTNQIDVLATVLGDRSVTRDRNTLIKLRSQLLTEVRREEGKTGGKASRLLVTFR